MTRRQKNPATADSNPRARQRAEMARRAAGIASREHPAPGNSTKRRVAIALAHDPAHDPGGNDAPRVVAKGYDGLAEQILRLAFDNDVKVRKDPDLAGILGAIEVDCGIPVEAFAAVAEILTYVYQANARLRPGEEP